MGLFDPKFCAVCGKKKGLFGQKLSDGKYLCGDCALEYVHYETCSKVQFQQRKTLSQMSLEEYQALVQVRKENLDALQQFDRTSSFCGYIQIDEATQQIVFAENKLFQDTKKLFADNPPVFKIENLAFMRLTYSHGSVDTTITGGAKMETTVHMILGFEDPLYDILRLEIGSFKSKSGIFGVKTTMSPDLESLTETISNMLCWEISWSADNDVLTPAASMDAYWTLAKRAKDYGYLSSEDITECLKNYYGKDRNKIREVKKAYKL